MSTTRAPGVLWDTIRHLQELTKRHVPGSEAHDVADHAIDLALSGRRAAENPRFLYRNVLRDSRRIRRRRPGHQRVVLDPSGATGRSDHATAEESAIARELEAALRHAAARADADGERCFLALLALGSIAQVSSVTNLPLRRVRRVRESVASCAAAYASGHSAK